MPSHTPETLATPDTVVFTTVDLIGNVTYAFLAAGATEAGGTLQDPAMIITDLTTTHVFAAQDNSLLSLDPLILFTAPISGPYAIGVGSLQHQAGTYTLSVTQAGVPISFGALGHDSTGALGHSSS